MVGGLVLRVFGAFGVREGWGLSGEGGRVRFILCCAIGLPSPGP